MKMQGTSTAGEMQVFKVDDSISFERVLTPGPNVIGEKGTVFVVVKDGFSNQESNFEIPPNIWASLVLSMSAFGERPNDWHAFLAHHQGEQDMLAAAKTVQTIKNVIKADSL